MPKNLALLRKLALRRAEGGALRYIASATVYCAMIVSAGQWVMHPEVISQGTERRCRDSWA